MFGLVSRKEFESLKTSYRELEAKVVELSYASKTYVGDWNGYSGMCYHDTRFKMTAIEMINRICNHLSISFEPRQGTSPSIALVSTKKDPS
jgi:uncharacterized membrane protein